MYIETALFDLLLPGDSRSLKQKRSYVRPIIAMLNGATAGLGLVHALFAGTVLVNVLLPLVHPRIGTPFTAADSTPLLEAPGFMLLNYGASTPLVMLVTHVIYGAIVGAGAGS